MAFWPWAALGGWFASLAVAITWPLVLRFTESLYANEGTADIAIFLWNLWWVKEAVLHAANPLWTPMLYYPQGISLAYHTLSLPQGLLALPWTLSGNYLVAYNLVVLLSLASSGFAMALLAKGITHSWLAATFAGTAFVLTPGISTRVFAANLNLLAWQWALLTCWAFLHLVAYRGRWPWALAFGLLAALSVYTDLLFSVLLGLLLPTLYLQAHGFRRPGSTPSLNIALGLFVAGLVLSPLITGLIGLYPEVAASAPWVANQVDLKRYSATLTDYLLPRSGSEEGFMVYGHLLPLQTPSFASGEKAFPGFTALGLALVGVFRSPRLWPLLAMAALGGILSLGPEVRISGSLLIPNYIFQAFQALPFMGISRTPGRFSYLVLVAMAILASGGLERMITALKGRGTWIGLLAIGLVVLELMPVAPIKEPPPVPSEPVLRTIQENGPGTVLELPRLGMPSLYRMEYHQVYHGMPLVTGYVSRPQFGDLSGDDLLEPQNALSSLRMLSDDRESFLWNVGPDGVPRLRGFDPREHVLTVLGYFDVRYILVDKSVASSSKQRQLLKVVTWLSAAQQIAEDANFVVYQVQPRPVSVVADFGEEWHGWEWSGEHPFRWSQGLSSLYLLARQHGHATVQLTAWSYGQPRDLQISMDGKTLTTQHLVPTQSSTITLDLNISKGMHRIILQASGQSLPEPAPGNRMLSFAITKPVVQFAP